MEQKCVLFWLLFLIIWNPLLKAAASVDQTRGVKGGLCVKFLHVKCEVKKRKKKKYISSQI